jgi:hypothetical protein
VTLRQRFGRCNAPFEMKWAAGGTNQQYYRLDPQIAEQWNALRHADGTSGVAADES